jgi:hypothetical protein
MKQTAVEWLQECLSSHLSHQEQMQFEGLFQQAKAMEKEQMFSYTKQRQVIGEKSMRFFTEDFEQYYNETYGK